MNDITIIRFDDQAVLENLRAIVHRAFGDHDYLDAPLQDYHRLAANAQAWLNNLDFPRRLARELSLSDLLRSDDVMIQSNLYLRAARPRTDGQEAVGWHRESMYGCQPQALNVWIPVLNVVPQNSMRYVPGSAEISDEDLEFAPEDSAGVEKGSDGHKIGLLYAPKRIIGGVDLVDARPLVVPDGSAAVFSSMLIHGAAQNRTNKIRFSVDFRVIAREHVQSQKKSFAGDGQDFFVPLAA